ncbi:MAG: tryptophan synthase subunit alpha [Phenylobacterium sp.]|nr:tryptophan synthase subunit alpha [Phenylobacterium sp.]MBP8247488.1 tryptophan synthase subunit alpha [Phenylobacterium sp.]
MTKARIDARFAALKAEDRAAFVAYIMAGDPDYDRGLEILKGLPAAGADLIEVGFPFSDPMAEGPPIQRAALRALDSGMTLSKTLAMIAEFRKGDQTTPIILMGYANPLINRGFQTFAQDAAAAGADGLIVVDIPPEEADPLADALDAENLSLLLLSTPTSDDARLKVIARRTSGFAYYVSVAGVTGVKEADAAAVAPHVARVRAAGGLPVCVGFGIKTPERAEAVARVADGVVVGSALVEEIAASLAMNETVTTRVLSKVQSLAKAVRFARVASPAV